MDRTTHLDVRHERAYDWFMTHATDRPIDVSTDGGATWRPLGSRLNPQPTATHRHDVTETAVGIGHDDWGNPYPTTTHEIRCEALEPWNDPDVTTVELETEDGTMWAECPNCREPVKVGT